MWLELPASGTKSVCSYTPLFSGTACHYNQMAHVLPILAGVADILDCQQGQILTNMLVGKSESILKQRVERLESATHPLWAGIDTTYFWELQLKGIHPGAGADANIFPAILCFLLSSLLKENRGMLPTENRTTLPNRTDINM